MQLEPIFFLSAWPKFLLSGDLSRPITLPSAVAEKLHSVNEKSGEYPQSEEECWYQGKMHEYASTKLRPEFTKELQRIHFPLAAAISGDSSSYTQDLHNRITHLDENCWEHAAWVKDLTGLYLAFDDDDDDGDDGEVQVDFE